MTANHHSTPSRGRTPRVLLAAALVLALAAAFFVLRHDNPASQPPAPAPAPPPATAPPTTLNPEQEVVARLREILRVRDEAYRNRKAGMLADIYASDCPCLRGDSRAIKELLQKGHIWVGEPSSISVRDTQRVTDRLWIVVAMFRVPILRVETTSGQLIERFPAENNLFRFALVRMTNKDPWLLGRASQVGEKS
jgi:hypothetical protein